MALADALDSSAANGFIVTVDGIQIPKVNEVSGLKSEVDKIELKQQTSDGKYVVRQLIGRAKAGEFTVTRGLTDSKTITDWLKTGRRGRCRRLAEDRIRAAARLRRVADQDLQLHQLLGAQRRGQRAQGRRRGAGDREVRGLLRRSDRQLMQRGPAPRRLGDPGDGRRSGSGPPRSGTTMRTEFDFELPRGYVDGDGVVHRHGTMRLATARDELLPLYDERVQENPAFTTVVLLGRVITRLGTVAGDERAGRGEHVRQRRGVPPGLLPPDQRRGPHPGRGDLPRAARTGSRSTSQVGAWGNRDVRAAAALRGGRVRRLPLPLGASTTSSTSSTRSGCASSARSRSINTRLAEER